MARSLSLWSILLVAVFSFLAAVECREVVCYYGTWAVYRPQDSFKGDDVNPSLCTQLVYAFFDVNSNGGIFDPDPWASNDGHHLFAKFRELKQRNPALKTLAAVGGWNAGTANFKAVAGDAQKRIAFAKNAVALLQQNGFDGMDIDWEYPDAADKANFVLLLKELANAFAPYKYLLTVAVGAGEGTASVAYDIPAISGIVSFINLMTYDMQENFGVTRHHAAVNQGPANLDDTDFKRSLNVEAVLKYWLSKGAAASKLTLGIPFYGRTFTLANPNVNGVGAPTNGAPGFRAYYEICRSDSRKLFDSVQIGAYAYSGSDWVTYDNVDSITQKCNVIAKYGLAGGMIWSIDQDDFLGKCGSKYGLLTALNSCVNKNAGTQPATTAKTTARPVTSTPAKTPAPPATTTKTTARPIATTTRKASSGPFVCPRDGFFRDPQNCSKFYRCYDGGRQASFDCPANLYFNEAITACDYKSNVNC